MGYAYWAILLLSTLAAIAVAGRVAARPGVDGPDRLPPEEPAMPYLLALAVGLLVWAMVPQLYLRLVRGDAPAAPPASQPAAQLSHFETVTLGNIANFAPFLAMLAVYAATRPAGLGRLGLAPRDLPRAVVPGLAGGVFAIPVVTWVALLTGWVFRKFGVEHPLRHELLEILDTSRDPAVRVLMLTGAAVAAPLFEELLFRGHIQTILADARGGRLRQRTEPRPEVTADAPRPSPAVRWAAIVICSALFAAVHPWWSQPAIFILSLCLGYAYERTGNLYVPILIHFLFNGWNILVMLYGPRL